MSTTRSTLVLLFTLFWAYISYVAADVCTGVAFGNNAACYVNRALCHFDLSQDACATGAPINCAQFLSDSVGCAGSTYGCQFSATAGLCSNKPQNCSLITVQAPCQQRSDCSWRLKNGTTSTYNCTTYTGGCRNNTNNYVSCAAQACYWDSTLQTCYNSLAEVVAINPCSSWSSLPIPNTACGSHGCSLDSTGLICSAASAAQAGNATASTLFFPATFVNPYMTPNSFTFNVQVWTANGLRINPAVWTYIVIGGFTPGYSVPGNFIPGACNNIQSYNYTQNPPAYLPISDPVGTQAYFNNFINSNHTYSFPTSNLTYGAVLYSLLGNINVRNATGVLDTSVSLDATSNWIVHQLSFDLNSIVTACAQATEVFTTSGHYYTIPISVVQRDYMNNYAQVADNFYISISTTGSVQSVSSSDQFSYNLFRSELTSMISTCPSGMALLNTVYLLSIGGVFAPNIFVGPRNASDIVWTTPTNGNVLNNCYGEKVTGFAKMGCQNNVCYTQVTTQTKCRPYDAVGGTSFNNCSFAQSADQIIDVGVGNSYPAALNSLHTFFVWDYVCPATSNATNNWANCTDSSPNTLTTPDVFTSTISILLFPTVQLSVSFDVYAGLLPFPSASLSLIETLSQGPNSVITAVDITNNQLQWNGIFTFVVGILAPNLRSSCNLTLDTASLFNLVGLDNYGNAIQGLQPLYIDQVFPYMTYVPKNLLQYCVLTGCLNTPATANQTAYDSFSIPVITLRTLLPANGYAVSVAYTLSLVSSSAATTLQHSDTHMHMMAAEVGAKSASRKLLSTAIGTNGITTQNGVYTFIFLINDGSNPVPPVVIIGAVNSTSITGVNTTTIIPGYQMVLRFYPDSSVPVGATNASAIEAYTLQTLPIVLSTLLNVNLNQITKMHVSDVQPLFSLALGDGQRGVPNPHRGKAMSLSSVGIGAVPYYATFVIIGNPLQANTTVQQLANLLVSAQAQPLLALNMGMNGLDLDVNYNINLVLVYLPPTAWYLTLTAPPTTTATPATTMTATTAPLTTTTSAATTTASATTTTQEATTTQATTTTTASAATTTTASATTVTPPPVLHVEISSSDYNRSTAMTGAFVSFGVVVFIILLIFSLGYCPQLCRLNNRNYATLNPQNVGVSANGRRVPVRYTAN